MNELTTNKSDVKFKPNWLGLKMMLKGGFKHKISIDDIKRYIHDEMSSNTNLQKEVHTLKNRLHEIDEWKEKYDLSCLTLEEYKTRLESKEEEIDYYINLVESLRRDIKKLKTQLGNLELQCKELRKENTVLRKENKKKTKASDDQSVDVKGDK